MPAVCPENVPEVITKLNHYLSGKKIIGSPEYINGGGSAAVFIVNENGTKKAIKVYDPKFLTGENAPAERKRLMLQKTLINHDCPTLIKIFAVNESFNTAFIEMEAIQWPSLLAVLDKVPNEKINILISQLVQAVRFLESKNIIHRDIKPENIHVSPNFQNLVLLDLGIARTYEDDTEKDCGAITDHGGKRPFISTAQYSSPDYLFRLSEPTPSLWKALNIYQVGAVLHDLIVKKPIFQNHVDLGNRWLLAKAVLTETPTFSALEDTNNLPLRVLAARCLVKDPEQRLSLVTWKDFEEVANSSTPPIDRVKNFLGKVVNSPIEKIEVNLDHEKSLFNQRIKTKTQELLITLFSKQYPPTCYLEKNTLKIEFSLKDSITLFFNIEFLWQTEWHSRTANIEIKSYFCKENSVDFNGLTAINSLPITINQNEKDGCEDLVSKIADGFMRAVNYSAIQTFSSKIDTFKLTEGS